ncbi:hypothetical protein [Streptomyces nojiriensis]|uniref:hypothetical protein n=1 Tax=Streptomyces nojiriensis TaxID=66374 RepID=UPI00369E8CCE
MRPPEELDSVDWASLRHGQRAEASNVPRIIRALYADDNGRPARELVRPLWVLTRWNAVYSATLAAIPFLAHAAVHVPRVRAELIHRLANIADGRGPGSAERGDEDAAAFGLVLAELPSLLRFLEDPDPETRRAVVALTPLASLVDEDVGDRLAQRYEEDPDGPVRADAFSALAGLRADVVRRWAAEAVTDPEPLVRERAAVMLLEEAGTPYPAGLVEVLAQACSHAPPRDGLPSLLVGLPDPGHRTARVLDADAGAMAVVARRLIAAGDRGRWGSRRAERLASTYRSRSARMLLGLLGDERVEGLLPGHEPGAVPDTEDDADVLGELAAATGRRDLWRSVLRSSHLRDENRALRALSPAVTSELHPELVALLRVRRHARVAATALAEAGVATPEVMAALTEISREPDRYEPPADEHDFWDVMAIQDRGTARTENRITAAVSLARLGGPSEPALALPARASGGWLALARHLGPAGRPLLPLVEAALEEPATATRLWAAEAHRRITGDPYARGACPSWPTWYGSGPAARRTARPRRRRPWPRSPNWASPRTRSAPACAPGRTPSAGSSPATGGTARWTTTSCGRPRGPTCRCSPTGDGASGPRRAGHDGRGGDRPPGEETGRLRPSAVNHQPSAVRVKPDPP